MFTIYRLISPSGKSYIGLTMRSFKSRWTQHLSVWRTNRRNCKKLCFAFDKYHPNTWTHEFLYFSLDKSEAEQKEIEYIKSFDSINNGYNVLNGGTINRIGIKHSDETKLKISQIQKGRINSEESNKKNSTSHLGKKHGPMSEEQKLKLSLAHKGKPSHNKGKKLTIEQIEKLRTYNLGRKHTEEHKRKIGLSSLGRKHTNEAKLKLSIKAKLRYNNKKKLVESNIVLE